MFNVVTTEQGPINLDGCEFDDLALIQTLPPSKLAEVAKQLFPDEPLEEAVRCLQTYQDYACCRMKAISNRLIGRMQSALVWENAQETFYAQLPRFGKW